MKTKLSLEVVKQVETLLHNMGHNGILHFNLIGAVADEVQGASWLFEDNVEVMHDAYAIVDHEIDQLIVYINPTYPVYLDAASINAVNIVSAMYRSLLLGQAEFNGI